MELRLSKVSKNQYFFNTVRLNQYNIPIWCYWKYQSNSLKKNRSTITFVTQGSTDINIITNVLVCVHIFCTVCRLLIKKKDKNNPILGD